MSQCSDGYMYSATLGIATFEAQLMKKGSNIEAALEKSVTYKIKVCSI